MGFSWLTVYDRNHAMEDIYGLIDEVLGVIRKQYNVSRPPVMLGFSQGCSIVHRYHLHGKRPVQAIIACGGDLPKDVRPLLEGNAPVAVLLVHARDDGIVPFSKGEEALQILRDGGVDPAVHHFDGGHEIPESVARFIGAWVQDPSTDMR